MERNRGNREKIFQNEEVWVHRNHQIIEKARLK